VTTFSQIVLLLATLADLAFTLDWGTLRMILVWTAAALTVASWAAYLQEALRAGGKGK
jgi:phosphatidylglycerophosphate synthase